MLNPYKMQKLNFWSGAVCKTTAPHDCYDENVLM